MSNPVEIKPKFQLKNTQSIITGSYDKTPLQLKQKTEQINITGLTTPDSLAMTKLNDQMRELVQNNTLCLFMELLKKISQDYNLPLEDLNAKYMNYFKASQIGSNVFTQTPTGDLTKLKASDITSALMEDDSPTKSETTDTEENTSPNIDQNKCYARTGGSKQCSRKKQKGQDFCGSHMHNQPNGRIDQIIETSKTQPKKRGRPPKNSPKAVAPDVPIVSMDASIEEIHGIKYIIDSNTGYIYRIPENFNENVAIEMESLKLLGKKLSNNQINWYSDNDLIMNRPN